MKTFISIHFFVFFIGQLTFANPIVSSQDLLQSAICKKLLCSPSDTFKDSVTGETSVQYLLTKDPSSYDLAALFKNNKMTKLTFKFMSQGENIDKELVKLLIISAGGKEPELANIDKLVTLMLTKTKKAELDAVERITFDKIKCFGGNVLKKPTLVIEF